MSPQLSGVEEFVLFGSSAALRRHLSLCDVAQKERRGKVMEAAHRLTQESTKQDAVVQMKSKMLLQFQDLVCT